VRFNPDGFIDVRNGPAYASDLSLSYVSGKSYRVRMLVDMPMHRYDVYVTPSGEAEVALARSYAFRTEQATVSQLSNRAIYASSGSRQLSGFSVSSIAAPTTTTSTTTTTTTPPPAKNTQPPVVSITSPVNGAVVSVKSTVQITAQASDNVGVARVEFYANGALRCTDSVTPYTCSWSMPGGRGKSHRLQAVAHDAAGNPGSSAVVNVTSR
jgi:hypothetical protein